MRNIQTVIDQISALIPTNPTPDIAANMIVLQAELQVLSRTAAYTPPESSLNANQWARLETVLYRYMPPVSYAPWCAQISALVVG